MQLTDFFYFIGYGVAFCMMFHYLSTGLYSRKELPEAVPAILFLSLIGGFLSWSLPIFCIGKKIYERIFEYGR